MIEPATLSTQARAMLRIAAGPRRNGHTMEVMRIAADLASAELVGCLVVHWHGNAIELTEAGLILHDACLVWDACARG